MNLKMLPLAVCAILALGMVDCKSQSASTSDRESRKQKGGWLGVSVQDVTDRIVKRYKLKDDNGAFVASVVDDSPADSAGIHEGDVIVSFDGKSIEDSDDLVRAVGRALPGSAATVGLIRDGEQKSLSVNVGRMKNRSASFGAMPFIMTPRPMPRMMGFTGGRMFGLTLETLNDQLGEYFGAPDNEGVLVKEVERKSVGEKAGFKAGDVIVRAGKRTVEEINDIEREISRHDGGDKVEVEVLRKGAKKTLSVEVEDAGRQERWNFAPGDGADIRIFGAPRRIEGTEEFGRDFSMPDVQEFNSRLEGMMKDLRRRLGSDGEQPVPKRITDRPEVAL